MLKISKYVRRVKNLLMGYVCLWDTSTLIPDHLPILNDVMGWLAGTQLLSSATQPLLKISCPLSFADHPSSQSEMAHDFFVVQSWHTYGLLSTP